MVVNNLNSFESKEQTVKDLMDLPVGEQEGFISPQEHYLLTLERQRKIIKEEMKASMQKGEPRVPLSVNPYDELRSELSEKGWTLSYDYSERSYYMTYNIESVIRSLKELPPTTHGGGCEVE